MLDPALIKQERQLLRLFRGATLRRANAEAEAASREKGQREAAELAFGQLRDTLSTQLGAAETRAAAKLEAERKAAQQALESERANNSACSGQAEKALAQARESL